MDLALGVPEILITTFLSLFFVWFLYRWSLFNLRSFPPGPIGFPILGYLGMFFDYPDKVLLNLGKKYGKIFSLYVGPRYTIVITDYDIAKELLSHPASLSRPPDVFGFIPGRGGFSGINGAEWLEQRRFCVFSLRNLGMGRGPWEEMIQASVSDFVEELRSWKGKPTDVSEEMTLSLAIVNISLLMGRLISKKSERETQMITDALELLSQHFSSSSLSALVPWLADFLVQLRVGGYHKRKERLREFEDMFHDEIDSRMKAKNVQHSEDFIGLYLMEMEKKNASGEPHYFSVENLIGNLTVLFFASTDTSTSSLAWLIKLMALHPEIQKRVHEEIHEFIGRDGQAAWDDRKKLPYTFAVVLELERYSAVNRLFPPRVTTDTFECGGYTIPKGSRLVVHSWAVMHDPKYWNSPMDFVPERFIRDDEKDPSKMDGLSTFSFGRRNCPGETISLMTIFLYFTAIMQKFQIKPAPDISLNLDIASFGIVVNPFGQELCFIER